VDNSLHSSNCRACTICVILTRRSCDHWYHLFLSPWVLQQYYTSV
jgi:hypothetical protein